MQSGPVAGADDHSVAARGFKVERSGEDRGGAWGGCGHEFGERRVARIHVVSEGHADIPGVQVFGAVECRGDVGVPTVLRDEVHS